MKYVAYSEYKPNGSNWLDNVPSHWNVKPLKLIVSMPITDGPHETPEFIPEGVPFASVEAVWNGKVHLSSVRGYISEEDHRRYSKKYHPQKGDIFIVKSGSTTGKIAIVDFDNDFNVWSPLAAVRCDVTQALPEFVFYALSSSYFQRLVQVSWSFGTQPNIGMGVLGNLPAVLPPINEQRAIALFLSAKIARIDELVAKKSQFIDKLKEKRCALIARTVTRGLPPDVARTAGIEQYSKMKNSGIDWLGAIPSHWDIEKFTRVVHIAEGQVDPEMEPFASMFLIAPNHIESGTGRLLALETAAEQFAESGKYLCPANAVIYSKIRPALRKVVIAPEQCLCSADMYPLTCKKRLLNHYLYWLLLSDQFSAWSILEADRVAMPKINRETLNELRVPIPPQNEQLKIVEYLAMETANIDHMLVKAEAVINSLIEYRQALITSAVTGKIDVRELA